MNQLPRLIGLAGPKGVGKSTLASALQALGYTRLWFAWPLKQMLTAVFGLDFQSMTTVEKETPIPWLGLTPRWLMQTLGTEWARRCLGKDVWVHMMRRQIASRRLTAWSEDSSDLIVIDDVRFDNEAQMIRELGGIIVNLNRTGPPRTGTPRAGLPRLWTWIKRLFTHASERGLSSRMIDFQVNLSDFIRSSTCSDADVWISDFFNLIQSKTQGISK